MSRKLSLPLVLLVITAVIVAVFLFVADPLFNLDVGLIRDTGRASSTNVLLAGRELFRLNTMEVLYKFVFPYDFVPEDTDWKSLLEARKAQTEDDLTAEKLEYLEVYDLCMGMGIDLSSDRRDFVVVTTIAKLGFNLDSQTYTGGMGPIRMRDDGSAVIELPEATVTDLIIRDESSERYDYPDISISPENWRRLVSYVAEKAYERIEGGDILEEAAERGRFFVESFFRLAGYDSVIFEE